MNHDLLCGDGRSRRRRRAGRAAGAVRGQLLRPPRRQPASREGPIVDWARLGRLRAGRHDRADGGDDRRPARRPHPAGPAAHARHDHDRGPRPGPGRRLRHPPRHRPGVRALLRGRLRRPRPLRLVARRPLRPRPRRRRAHRAGPAAAGCSPAHGERAGRSRLDRRARTARPVRPQLRHRDPAGRGRRPRRSTAPCSGCSWGAADVPDRLTARRPRVGADRRLRPDR